MVTIVFNGNNSIQCGIKYGSTHGIKYGSNSIQCGNNNIKYVRTYGTKSIQYGNDGIQYGNKR